MSDCTSLDCWGSLLGRTVTECELRCELLIYSNSIPSSLSSALRSAEAGRKSGIKYGLASWHHFHVFIQLYREIRFLSFYVVNFLSLCFD